MEREPSLVFAPYVPLQLERQATQPVVEVEEVYEVLPPSADGGIQVG
jgi:hypothetical protein